MKLLGVLFSLLFVASITNVSAQNQIKGILQDKQHHPINFGEIHLRLKGSENILNTYSDTIGAFKFDDIPSGLYHINFLYLGNNYDQRETYIDKNIDLGIITIDPQSQLSEIIIEGRKKIFETKIDRNVFNVANSLNASSGDALDAIKATPGLQVTNDDIKIIGKNSVSVMINDRLVQMSGAELNNYLKTLSASDIQKIEVITTPPAKYEAQGNGGLINIVLKKKKENAWSNSSRINYFQASYPNFRFGDTFTYSKDKLSAQASLDYSNGNYNRVERSTNIYPDEIWATSDLDKTLTKRLSARINIDYQITPKSNVGIQYMRNGFKKETIWNHAHTNIFDHNQQLTSEIFTNGQTSQKEQYENINFNYEYKMDTVGRKATLNVDYFSSERNNIRPFESNRIYHISTLPTEMVKATSSGDVAIDIYSAKLDFEHPMKFLKLDYGAKVNRIINDSDSKYFDRISGKPIQDLDKSDQFKYEELGQALYVSASKEWSPKWTTKLGLRMEATQTKGISYSLEQTEKKSFLDFFPTVYIQYQPSENHSLNLNYNKRISRPQFWALNPFRWYIDAYSYTQGNPFLEPFNTHKLELSYTYKNNWNTKIEFSRTENALTQIQNIDEINKTRIFSQENFYNINIFAINQSYTFSKYPWWQSINSVTVSQSETTFSNSNKQLFKTQNGVSAYFSSNNSFKINSKLSMEVNGYFNSKASYMIYKIDPSSSLNLAFAYKMLEDHLNITLNIYDVFRTEATKEYTQTANSKIIYNNYYGNRYMNLAITYNFGNKNIKSKKSQTGNEEERNRT